MPGDRPPRLRFRVASIGSAHQAQSDFLIFDFTDNAAAICPTSFVAFGCSKLTGLPAKQIGRAEKQRKVGKSLRISANQAGRRIIAATDSAWVTTAMKLIHQFFRLV